MQNYELRNTLWGIREKLPIFKKDTAGFKFKYTDLEAILKVVDPLLRENDIGYDHCIEIQDGKNVLTTSIFYANTENEDNSGMFVSSMIIPENVALSGMNAYQSLGSALTYFRRYALLVMLGILTGEDVDVLSPDQKKEKVNYVDKVESLIAMGRKRPSLEKFYENFKDEMDADEQTKVEELISKVAK